MLERPSLPNSERGNLISDLPSAPTAPPSTQLTSALALSMHIFLGCKRHSSLRLY